MRLKKTSARTRKTEWIRTELAYGKWMTAGGEVLFNRRYHPILERPAGGAWVKADRTTRIDWTGEVWFYDDSHTEAQRIKLASSAMADLGAPINWAEWEPLKGKSSSELWMDQQSRRALRSA